MDPKPGLESLRAWCARALEDPAAARAELDVCFDVAGALFDAHHLDGAQYSALYELASALRKGAWQEARDRARTCATLI